MNCIACGFALDTGTFDTGTFCRNPACPSNSARPAEPYLQPGPDTHTSVPCPVCGFIFQHYCLRPAGELLTATPDPRLDRIIEILERIAEDVSASRMKYVNNR